MSRPVSNCTLHTLIQLPREDRQLILDALKGKWPARTDERALERRQYLVAELDKNRNRP